MYSKKINTFTYVLLLCHVMFYTIIVHLSRRVMQPLKIIQVKIRPTLINLSCYSYVLLRLRSQNTVLLSNITHKNIEHKVLVSTNFITKIFYY